MNVIERLQIAAATRHLVLIEFFAAYSPHNVWLQPVVEHYAMEHTKTIEVINVNIVLHPLLAESYHVESVPAFLLLLRGKELWRQVGELTEAELLEMLGEF